MLQFLANGLCNAAATSLVAIGFGTIFFSTKTFHIAHGAVYTISAYACFAFLSILRVPLFLAVIAGLIAGILAGVLCERVVYYPLIDPRRKTKASSMVIMISSLGIYIAVVNLIAVAFGNETKLLRQGVQPSLVLGPIILSHVQIAQVLVAGASLVVYYLALRSTSFGRTLRAMADDDELVDVLGHNVQILRVGVFALGSGFAALGGMLGAFDVGITPHAGFDVLLVAAVATIVGGREFFLAPALGALVLALLESLVVWRTSQKWSNLVVFALLLVFLLFRPEGLLVLRKRSEES